MPFPPAAPRTHLHNRTINCQGYLRDDGLWEIEAIILDTKTYPFENRWRGCLEAGTPVHNMGLRLTIDKNFIVQAVATTMDDQPHEMCHQVLDNYQCLIGLQIGPGWNRKVKELLGGIKGCTHLVELLGPIATVAFQTMSSDTAKEMARKANPAIYPDQAIDATQKPFVLNSCYTWNSDGPAVQEVYPLHFTGSKKPISTDNQAKAG